MSRVPPLRLSGVAVLCCLVTIFAVAIKPVTDPDFWWHLATGRYMVAQHTIPTHDVFSLTARSHRWITHEWLTELLFYGGWVLGGFRLLMLGTAVVITTAFYLVYLAARERGAPAILAAPLILLAALASAHTWGARPQMLSLLLTAVYGLALTRMVVRRQAGPPLYLPALMVLWVNLHGGFIFGLALLSIATTGYLLQDLATAVRQAPTDRERAGAGHADFGRCALVVALTALATLANPNGLAGALYPLSYLGNNASTRYIAEWVSPDFHKVQYQLFEALLLIVVIGALGSPRRARLCDILMLLPFTYLAFQSVRNINLFCVIVTPLAAELAFGMLPASWRARRITRALSPRIALINCGFAAVIAAFVLVGIAGKLQPGAQARAEAEGFPSGAIRYVQAHQLPARGFDSYNWGGYLIWHWAPGRAVFVDGRPDMYGDRFMDSYINAYDGSPSWRTLLAVNHLCYVLVEPGTGIARALAGEHRWRLAYRDARSVLYLIAPSLQGCQP